MADPKPLSDADLRKSDPLQLLLEWHDVRAREVEPAQRRLLTELLRRLHVERRLEDLHLAIADLARPG